MATAADRMETDILRREISRLSNEHIVKDKLLHEQRNRIVVLEASAERNNRHQNSNKSASYTELFNQLAVLERNLRDKDAELLQLRQHVKMTSFRESELIASEYLLEIERLKKIIETQTRDLNQSKTKNSKLSKKNVELESFLTASKRSKKKGTNSRSNIGGSSGKQQILSKHATSGQMRQMSAKEMSSQSLSYHHQQQSSYHGTNTVNSMQQAQQQQVHLANHNTSFISSSKQEREVRIGNYIDELYHQYSSNGHADQLQGTEEGGGGGDTQEWRGETASGDVNFSPHHQHAQYMDNDVYHRPSHHLVLKHDASKFGAVPNDQVGINHCSPNDERYGNGSAHPSLLLTDQLRPPTPGTVAFHDNRNHEQNQDPDRDPVNHDMSKQSSGSSRRESPLQIVGLCNNEEVVFVVNNEKENSKQVKRVKASNSANNSGKRQSFITSSNSKHLNSSSSSSELSSHSQTAAMKKQSNATTFLTYNISPSNERSLTISRQENEHVQLRKVTHGKSMKTSSSSSAAALPLKNKSILKKNKSKSGSRSSSQSRGEVHVELQEGLNDDDDNVVGFVNKGSSQKQTVKSLKSKLRSEVRALEKERLKDMRWMQLQRQHVEEEIQRKYAKLYSTQSILPNDDDDVNDGQLPPPNSQHAKFNDSSSLSTQTANVSTNGNNKEKGNEEFTTTFSRTLPSEEQQNSDNNEVVTGPSSSELNAASQSLSKKVLPSEEMSFEDAIRQRYQISETPLQKEDKKEEMGREHEMKNYQVSSNSSNQSIQNIGDNVSILNLNDTFDLKKNKHLLQNPKSQLSEVNPNSQVAPPPSPSKASLTNNSIKPKSCLKKTQQSSQSSNLQSSSRSHSALKSAHDSSHPHISFDSKERSELFFELEEPVDTMLPHARLSELARKRADLLTKPTTTKAAAAPIPTQDDLSAQSSNSLSSASNNYENDAYEEDIETQSDNSYNSKTSEEKEGNGSGSIQEEVEEEIMDGEYEGVASSLIEDDGEEEDGGDDDDDNDDDGDDNSEKEGNRDENKEKRDEEGEEEDDNTFDDFIDESVNDDTYEGSSDVSIDGDEDAVLSDEVREWIYENASGFKRTFIRDKFEPFLIKSGVSNIHDIGKLTAKDIDKLLGLKLPFQRNAVHRKLVKLVSLAVTATGSQSPSQSPSQSNAKLLPLTPLTNHSQRLHVADSIENLHGDVDDEPTLENDIEEQDDIDGQEEEEEGNYVFTVNQGDDDDDADDNGFENGGDSDHDENRKVKHRNGLERSNSKINDAAAKSVGFHVGDVIEARYKGRHKWYEATIQAVNDNFRVPLSYSLKYTDDGNEEHSVPRIRIRHFGQEEPDWLKAGMACEARYHGGKKCFPGIIVWANGSEGQPTTSAMIEYEDGDKEADVPRHMIHVACE